MGWQIFRLGISETLNGISCLGLAIALIAADRAGTQAAIVDHKETAAAVSGGDVSATAKTHASDPDESADHARRGHDLQRTAETLETHTIERPASHGPQLEPSENTLGSKTGATQSPLAIAIPGISTPSAKRTSAIVPPIVRQRPKPAQVTTKPVPRSKKAVASRKAGSPAKKRNQTASAR